MLRKRIVLIGRRDDVSPERFDEYWRTDHARVIVALGNIVHYVQNRVIAGDRPDYPVHGIVESWFDDELPAPTPEALAAQVEDEPRFLRLHTGWFTHDTADYEAPAKAWLLVPGQPPADVVEAAAATGPITSTTADRALDVPVIDRERLVKVDWVPEQVLVRGYADETAALAAADAIRAALGERPGIVLVTVSRRMR